MSQVNNKLFEPITVGGVELKNRIVMLPITTNYAAEEKVTARLKDFLVQRAMGGVGLISVGLLTPIASCRGPFINLGIYDDSFIRGLQELTTALHANGTKVAAQLSLRTEWIKHGSDIEESVGPSDTITRRGASPPRSLTIEEIEQTVVAFGEGARRAREAGFDMLEIHAGMGYLINRFLSPCSNKRTDRYGGSLENRLRFLLEIIDSVKKKAGSNYALICRLSADEFMEGGHTLGDTKMVAPILEKAGIHAISVQAGWTESRVPLIQMSVPRGAFVYLAEGVKSVVNIPVATAYRINEPLLAEQIITEGKADLIGMARALIADPEFPRKAEEGRYEDIRPCIACGQCNEVIREDKKAMTCSVNTQVGMEAEYIIQPAERSKRVMIVGGGPAGMEAARVASQRGHQVTLVDKGNRLGGQLLVAATPPHKEEIGGLTRYLSCQVEKSGVEVKLGEEVNVGTIEASQPEVVIVATGARPILPDIPGVGASNVVTAIDVLTGSKDVGQTVIIIGGGLVGCETAEFLAEKGRQVTIVEMLERIGNDISIANRWVTLLRLKKAGISIETNTKVEEISDKGIVASCDGVSKSFESDTVVLAVGMRPNSELTRQLVGKLTAAYSIGDCVEPQRISQAIENGFQVAREI